MQEAAVATMVAKYLMSKYLSRVKTMLETCMTFEKLMLNNAC